MTIGPDDVAVSVVAAAFQQSDMIVVDDERGAIVRRNPGASQRRLPQQYLGGRIAEGSRTGGRRRGGRTVPRIAHVVVGCAEAVDAVTDMVVTPCDVDVRFRIVHEGVRRVIQPVVIDFRAEQLGGFGQVLQMHHQSLPMVVLPHAVGVVVRHIETIISHVEVQSGRDLLQVVPAGCVVRPVARFVQCRKQHRRQNGDDGNYNQKLDQCK
ncbi:hypothetical protein SDC9_162066 [bioreactor metagenome]|uniref:Uncharacterized protein n=1 Tax=bioreactor metagenome TaxID=1076179 RepID=A0A645FN24_9ZZZZ